jgi:hypothetical protein
VLIITHLEAVHCVNSVCARKGISPGAEQGNLSGWALVAGWQSCACWQIDDGPWEQVAHYNRSGSAPLIGTRLGVSSVVPSSKESSFFFFSLSWATAQMSATPPGPCRAMPGCFGFLVGCTR